jgi:hypothetical protein
MLPAVGPNDVGLLCPLDLMGAIDLFEALYYPAESG